MSVARQVAAWLRRLMRRRLAVKSAPCIDPRERVRALDRAAADATRVAEARLPPHQGAGLSF